MTKNTCLCIPLTTKNKVGIDYRDINLKDGIQRKVILSQIRLIDAKRLLGLIGILDDVQFQKIKGAIIEMLE